MPKKSDLKCYFGCVIDGPLHHFPMWDFPHTERFNDWKKVLDPETQKRGNNYIYNMVRLCYRHFEDFYQSKSSHRLTPNAVPTMNLGRNILPAACEETADFLLIFDKLFDSFNGHLYQDNAKIYKSCLKNNSLHFKLWADLLPILESIRFESIEKKNGVDVIKTESIPSVKNWIHNIKCMLEMWNELKSNHNINSLLMRNINQDPLEKFFSCVRSHGVRNINPTCDQFINTFKTLIINNINSPHSPAANCENDNNECMQSLKQLITEKHQLVESESDYHCEIDSLLNVISEIRNYDNLTLLHRESKKYVTGFVIKKCKSKVFKTCNICMNDFCRSEVDVDSFNYEVDYTKKSLHHPSDQLINLMNDMYYVIVACLRQFPESNFLKRKIMFFIDCACNFEFISCAAHKDDLINYMKNISCKIIIHSWCNGVNRLLIGKSIKYDLNDLVKNQAIEYCNKRKKYKK